MNRAGAVALTIAAGCGSHAGAVTSTAPPGSSIAFEFAVDAPAGSEAYTCFAFDAAPLAGRWLRALRWTPPETGNVALHHATLYLLARPFPDGPVACDAMPAATPVHVWAPGGDPLELPDDVGVAPPPQVQRLVIQTHVVRVADGPPARASVSLELLSSPPAHVAAWLAALGAIPAIRPHAVEHASTVCRAAAAMHVVTAWPHMHRIGTAFHASLVRGDGTSGALLDVSPWSFDRQATYAIDRDVAAGEGIETGCTWSNPTDAYVLPGLRTSDEMCGQGLVVWPAEAARWDGDCR